MSTTKALKKLYKAIVGSAPAENVNSAAKIISGIADKWSSSVDKELPAYTATDANKVLAVKSDGTLEWKTLG